MHFLCSLPFFIAFLPFSATYLYIRLFVSNVISSGMMTTSNEDFDRDVIKIENVKTRKFPLKKLIGMRVNLTRKREIISYH